MSKTFKDFVNDAKGRIVETTIDEVAAKLQTRHAFTLVDVREDDEWARGRIPGAIHLGRGVIERDATRVLPDTEREIVAYCGGGSRSALAADTLREMGYRKVASMIGGFGAWVESGRAVEK